MHPGPDLSLITTPDNPGLYVYAPVNPVRPFGRPTATPLASFACRCGLVQRGRGAERIQAVIETAQIHPEACPLNEASASSA